MKQRPIVSLLIALVWLFSLGAVAGAQAEPAVGVADQTIVDGTVTVESVTSSGPGWIAIHADADGKPGPVIGYAAVQEGENSNVVVEIDSAAATSVLHAMLHIDKGVLGTYEFPGPDAPAQVGDAVVMAPFSSQSAAAEETALMDVVDTAAANDDFSTLVAALQAAGLVDALKAEGPFTLFAPTNAAFQALPDGTLEGLLADPAGDLTQILLNHVVSGKVMAADVTDGLEVNSLQGGPLTFNVADGSVQVGEATITTTDIEASNGVIHVIDAVLLPAADGEMAEAEAAEAEAAAEATPEPTEEPAEEMAEAEATPEPTEEMAEEAAAEVVAEATATPEEEVMEEATAAPEEEMAEAEATPEPTEEAAEEMAEEAPAGESKGGVPQIMPTTGANVEGVAAPIAAVSVVLALLSGATVLARRRGH